MLALCGVFAIVAVALATNAARGEGNQGSEATKAPGGGAGLGEERKGKGKKGGGEFKIGFIDGQFSDNLLTSSDPEVRDLWFRRLEQSNAEFARINVYWSQTTGGTEPLSATDPADPSYNWSVPDGAVESAQKHGIEVLITVLAAPVWAEGPNRPAQVRSGAWKPNARKLGDFAEALATRYSGDYESDGVVLPRVRYYEAWNEPNLPNYISPQYNGKKPASSGIYRKMLNEFYSGVHAVNDTNRVVVGGTSPFGDKPGGKRQRPHAFWRNVLCLTKKLKQSKSCASLREEEVAHADIYATNSINDNKRPSPLLKPRNSDDSVPANFSVLGRIFGAAQKRGTVISASKKMPGWSTETWYESQPGDPKAVSAKKQAEYQEQSLYVLWREGARAVFFLQLKDTPYDPRKPGLLGFQTGVYLANGKKKPSLVATRFPFVADRKSKRKVLLWGKAPDSGRLTVSQKGQAKGRKTVAKIRVKEGQIFTKTVNLPGGHKLQAKVGKNKSLVWNLK